MLKPSVEGKVIEQQALQKESRDLHSKYRSFEVGGQVMARDYRPSRDKWKKGVIMEKMGDRSYQVQVDDGIWKRHVDQLLPRNESSDNGTKDGWKYLWDNANEPDTPSRQDSGTSTVERRYPSRSRNPPNRYY